ncbi:MAG: Uncharacterised protein [Rhodospirillaceae bacterium]|nr:MAG: Uncharacterised protein [Rhodospirillaceae bacterium]
MADFATARAAHPAGLAHGVGWEVVVQHEVRAVFTLDAVDDLFILRGTQRGGYQRLGLTAGEDRRAVGAWQHGGLGDDRAHGLGVATVDPHAGVEDAAADDVLLQLLERAADHAFVELLGKGFLRSRLGGANGFHAILLDCVLVGFSQGGFGLSLYRRGAVGQLGRWLGQIDRVLGAVFGEIDDHVDHRLEALVAKLDRAEHDFFGQLLSFRFHHHHAFGGAGHDQLEAGFLDLGNGRVEDVFAVLVADLGSADRAEERQAGNGQCRRSGNQGQHVTVVLEVVAEQGQDDLGLVLVAIDEQRANRPVNQAADQRLFLSRAALTLEEAAGNAACGRVLFLIVDGQGEEIDAFLGLAGPDSRGEHNRVAVTGEHRPIRLARHAPGFQRQRATAPLNRFPCNIKHVLSYDRGHTDAPHAQR